MLVTGGLVLRCRAIQAARSRLLAENTQLERVDGLAQRLAPRSATGAHPGSGRALPLAFLRTDDNINDCLHFTSVMMAALRIPPLGPAAPNHCASSRATPPEPSSSTCTGEASAR
ncbi:hypothetical protein GCM10010149_33110 [Nonomuraea roseoviolacea subsp. roseoviolacea]